MSPAKIKLNATSGGGSVSLEAPSSTTGNANVEFKLPVADGVGSLVSDGSGNLSIGGGGGGAELISKDFTLASGASTTNAKVINTNQSGEVEQYPQMSTVGTFVTDALSADGINNLGAGGAGYMAFSRNVSNPGYRVKYVVDDNSNKARITITGQVMNTDGTYTDGTSAQFETDSESTNGGVSGAIAQWTGNYWIGTAVMQRSASSSSSRHARVASQMFTVDPSNGNITLLGSLYKVSHNYDRGSNVNPRYASYGILSWYTSGWNSYSVSFYETANRNIVVYHYRPTTSGLSQIQFWNHGYSPAYTGNNVIFQGGDSPYQNSPHGGLERCALLSGDKSSFINQSTYEVYDYTGVGSTQTQISSTALNGSGGTAYLSDGLGVFINGTHFIYFYKDINNRNTLQTYSYDQSGGFTLIDTLAYETTTISNDIGTVKVLSIKSATEIGVLTYTINGVYGLSSIELDSSYNILGIKTPLLITGTRDRLNYTGSGNIFHTYNTDTSGNATVAPYTINSYKDTVPFIYGGVAQETKSSGTAKIALGGVATGFTGLTVGTKYYVSGLLNGDITTSSTSGIVVGTAIKATEMLIGDVR